MILALLIMAMLASIVLGALGYKASQHILSRRPEPKALTPKVDYALVAELEHDLKQMPHSSTDVEECCSICKPPTKDSSGRYIPDPDGVQGMRWGSKPHSKTCPCTSCSRGKLDRIIQLPSLTPNEKRELAAGVIKHMNEPRDHIVYYGDNNIIRKERR